MKIKKKKSKDTVKGAQGNLHNDKNIFKSCTWLDTDIQNL